MCDRLTVDNLLGAALALLSLPMRRELVDVSGDLVALAFGPGLLGVWLDGVLHIKSALFVCAFRYTLSLRVAW